MSDVDTDVERLRILEAAVYPLIDNAGRISVSASNEILAVPTRVGKGSYYGDVWNVQGVIKDQRASVPYKYLKRTQNKLTSDEFSTWLLRRLVPIRV